MPATALQHFREDIARARAIVIHANPPVAARLQSLLDCQDAGQPLTYAERDEGIVDLVDLLTLLRMRAEQNVG